jgi:hypothetical protein
LPDSSYFIADSDDVLVKDQGYQLHTDFFFLHTIDQQDVPALANVTEFAMRLVIALQQNNQ